MTQPFFSVQWSVFSGQYSVVSCGRGETFYLARTLLPVQKYSRYADSLERSPLTPYFCTALLLPLSATGGGRNATRLDKY